jgi:hypothetical protein
MKGRLIHVRKIARTLLRARAYRDALPSPRRRGRWSAEPTGWDGVGKAEHGDGGTRRRQRDAPGAAYSAHTPSGLRLRSPALPEKASRPLLRASGEGGRRSRPDGVGKAEHGDGGTRRRQRDAPTAAYRPTPHPAFGHLPRHSRGRTNRSFAGARSARGVGAAFRRGRLPKPP